MKRTTVVRHLREIAERADDVARRMTVDLGATALTEIWTGGDVCSSNGLAEQSELVLVLDLSADEVPVLALHPDQLFWASWLDLRHHPLLLRAVSAEMPPWDHLRREVARIWSLDDGPETAVLDALQDGRGSEVSLAPTDLELGAFITHHLPRSRSHLRDILDHYWDSSWRAEHTNRGDYVHPDDHLWRAAEAVQSMEDALADLALPT